MASLGEWTDKVSRRRGVRAARAVLFPELDAAPPARFAAGLLRAPRRGRCAAPILSLCPLDAVPRQRPPAALATPARLLGEPGWEDPALLARAAAARARLVAARVAGAWWEADAAATLPAGRLALVALAEPPPPGRAAAATADPATTGTMLDAALRAFPAARIVVLTPARPDRRLREPLERARAQGATVIARACDPWPLLDRTDRVYSIGGEIGFLALLAGRPVTVFAAACYTGWGATEDHAAVPRHAFRRSADEIFAAICLVATRCRDPFRDAALAFEDALTLLADWRRLDAANRRVAVCVGISFWKRRRFADFVRSSAGLPRFRRTVAGALRAARAHRGGDGPGAIAGWASRLPAGLAEAAARAGVPLIRVEDGFIRSVGLGSDFLPPASLVFDASGLYLDPRRDSDLERLLREGDFPPELLARAARLRERLVARGITKYNLPARDPVAGIPADRHRILVPGQVADDLSLRFGAGAARGNLDLLARVRAANPDAFIIYKPHPDIVAGHRIGAVPDREARRFADRVVANDAIDRLLAVSDEVHTMTSLVGFEALLRGRRVVVYGRPFYAGWGLTTDLPPFDRGRRLSLDQLVAGALILYPRYLDPLTRLPCGPELLIERLARAELWRAGALVRVRRWQGRLARHLWAWRAARSPARIGENGFAAAEPPR
jgi:capsular polysaccharide export protein